MSAPKKPTKQPLIAKAVAPGAPPPELTPAELRLLKLFRTMDDRGRVYLEAIATGQAERWPRRKGPNLRLIPGGA